MTLKDFIEKGDRFAAHTGVEIEKVAEDYARATLTVAEHHLNAGGVCQGGAIFTLADTALACASNSHLMLTFSIESSIYYHKSALKGEVLTAEAVALCPHRKIPSFEVKVTNRSGELIASFRAISYTKQVPLENVEGLE